METFDFKGILYKINWKKDAIGVVTYTGPNNSEIKCAIYLDGNETSYPQSLGEIYAFNESKVLATAIRKQNITCYPYVSDTQYSAIMGRDFDCKAVMYFVIAFAIVTIAGLIWLWLCCAGWCKCECCGIFKCCCKRETNSMMVR